MWPLRCHEQSQITVKSLSPSFSITFPQPSDYVGIRTPNVRIKDFRTLSIFQKWEEWYNWAHDQFIVRNKSSVQYISTNYCRWWPSIFEYDSSGESGQKKCGYKLYNQYWAIGFCTAWINWIWWWTSTNFITCWYITSQRYSTDAIDSKVQEVIAMYKIDTFCELEYSFGFAHPNTTYVHPLMKVGYKSTKRFVEYRLLQWLCMRIQVFCIDCAWFTSSAQKQTASSSKKWVIGKPSVSIAEEQQHINTTPMVEPTTSIITDLFISVESNKEIMSQFVLEDIVKWSQISNLLWSYFSWDIKNIIVLFMEQNNLNPDMLNVHHYKKCTVFICSTNSGNIRFDFNSYPILIKENGWYVINKKQYCE